MQPITFIRDLLRFRQEGLLFTLCYLLFARIELLFWYGLFIALCVVFRGYPNSVILLCLVGVALTLHLFVNFTVKLLTPVFFGPFVIGRLRPDPAANRIFSKPEGVIGWRSGRPRRRAVGWAELIRAFTPVFAGYAKPINTADGFRKSSTHPTSELASDRRDPDPAPNRVFPNPEGVNSG
jgi:hypothetical protein